MSKLRVALVLLGDAMLCVALVLLTQIDKLVNSTLYGYGLVFDDAWAQPYWLMLKVCMVSIVAAIILISVVELPYPAFQEKTEETKEDRDEDQGEVVEVQVEEQQVGVLEPESREDRDEDQGEVVEVQVEEQPVRVLEPESREE